MIRTFLGDLASLTSVGVLVGVVLLAAKGLGA